VPGSAQWRRPLGGTSSWRVKQADERRRLEEDKEERMVVKYIKDGVTVHGPPYTKAEEADFYRRNAGGPVTVTRRADDRKAQKVQAPRRQSQNRKNSARS
jgi:hypothetical protein